MATGFRDGDEAAEATSGGAGRRAFAGRGRHAHASPASGKRLMQCAQRQRCAVDTSVIVVQKAATALRRLSD
jgi:hypothetical protein